MLLTWGSVAPAHAQDSAKDDKPTFYHLVPGTYVNGWPRFTMTYPKDWVEGTPNFQDIFLAVAPGPTRTGFAVTPSPFPPLPFDKLVDLFLTYWKAVAKDVTVVSNKPSRLQDGTPAQEIEYHMEDYAGRGPFNWVTLAIKRGDSLINTSAGSDKKIGEDLKGILYSLTFQSGKDEPVKVPPEIQEFLDKWRDDVVSHDVAKVMTHYSDRYLESGTKKAEVERDWKENIGPLKSFEVGITDFEAAGDKAYLAGFTNRFARYYGGRWPLRGTSIIKENGEWKWYGNQREVIPLN
jgi:ketosteroid isomerase-like protein